MSWFTAAANVGQPPCERCHKPNFVALVKSAGEFRIWDCKACGPIVPKESKDARMDRR